MHHSCFRIYWEEVHQRRISIFICFCLFLQGVSAITDLNQRNHCPAFRIGINRKKPLVGIQRFPIRTSERISFIQFSQHIQRLRVHRNDSSFKILYKKISKSVCMFFRNFISGNDLICRNRTHHTDGPRSFGLFLMTGQICRRLLRMLMSISFCMNTCTAIGAMHINLLRMGIPSETKGNKQNGKWLFAADILKHCIEFPEM